LKTSVITVTHNSGDVVAGMLAGLPADVEAIVVDNASTDGSLDIARSARADAVVIESSRNGGFGYGCNLGADVASGDVLVFMNPDCRSLPGAVELLADRARADRRSIFGPAFLDGDGRLRHNLRRSSQPYHEALELLPSAKRWVPQRLRRDLSADDPRYENGGDADYLQGACLAVDRAFFLSLGGFDEDYFLYGEEETLCDAVRATGGRCVYVPSALVSHVGGTSTAQVGDFAVTQLFRSHTIFYRKRYGELGGLAANVMILGALLLHWSLSAVATLAGRGPTVPIPHYAALRGMLAGAVHRSGHASSRRPT
jgi:N-acetylglucosaminyl-diphospho-decaprenol L-rhamnosyltransferase